MLVIWPRELPKQFSASFHHKHVPSFFDQLTKSICRASALTIRGRVMKRYWTVVGTMIVFFLLLFLLVERLQIPLLTDPAPWLKGGGAARAALRRAQSIQRISLPGQNWAELQRPLMGGVVAARGSKF